MRAKQAFIYVSQAVFVNIQTKVDQFIRELQQSCRSVNTFSKDCQSSVTKCPVFVQYPLVGNRSRKSAFISEHINFKINLRLIICCYDERFYKQNLNFEELRYSTTVTLCSCATLSLILVFLFADNYNNESFRFPHMETIGLLCFKLIPRILYIFTIFGYN